MFKRASGLRALILSATLSACGAGVTQAQPNGGQCLLSTNVENFSAPDTHTVYLRVGANQIWRLDLMNDCLELPNRLNIGLQATGGDPWICKPIQATIMNQGVAVPHRCPVRALHLLTPAQVAALPKRDRP